MDSPRNAYLAALKDLCTSLIYYDLRAGVTDDSVRRSVLESAERAVETRRREFWESEGIIATPKENAR